MTPKSGQLWLALDDSLVLVIGDHPFLDEGSPRPDLLRWRTLSWSGPSEKAAKKAWERSGWVLYNDAGRARDVAEECFKKWKLVSDV